MFQRIALIVIATCVSLCARGGELSDPNEWQSLVIRQTATPGFPLDLLDTGITTGEARIAIAVDHDGALQDLLVVGYTRKQFADASLDAIGRWHFDPARRRGEPIACQALLVVDFEKDGVAVRKSNIVFESRADIGPPDVVKPAFRTLGLSELDHLPAPIAIVRPTFPEGLRNRGVSGTAVVEFYIDETGHVRMPAVESTDFPELGENAVEALRQWRFDPPTRFGEPGLVHVRQRFVFALPPVKKDTAAAK